jgi:hypothetical protein
MIPNTPRDPIINTISTEINTLQIILASTASN